MDTNRIDDRTVERQHMRPQKIFPRTIYGDIEKKGKRHQYSAEDSKKAKRSDRSVWQVYLSFHKKSRD